MRSWVALLLLSACNHDRALENDRCTGSIEEFCAGGQCPLSRDDWCAGGMPFPFYGFNGMAACNGWSFVVQQDLDQPRYYFYDSTGKLVAVLAAVSDPPCLGACSWVCSAGPADQSAAELSSCTAAADYSHCGDYTVSLDPNGQLILSPEDGGAP